MNRLFALTALSLFLGLDASRAQTSLHKQKWTNKSMKHHVLLQTGFHGPLNWQNQLRVTFAKLFPVRLRYAAIVHLSGNYVIAMKWWRRAAERGSAAAQIKLAHLYEGRGGIPTDYTQAYKWYDIAAAIAGAKIDALPVAASHNGEKDNSDQLWYRDQVAKHMTSEQIAEAQRLAREWKPEQ